LLPAKFEEIASQFEEVPQSCHGFGEELPVSLKKCHSATAGLEKSQSHWKRAWLKITGLEFPYIFYLLWILLKSIYKIWSLFKVSLKSENSLGIYI
jgi:hypothetical protein